MAFFSVPYKQKKRRLSKKQKSMLTEEREMIKKRNALKETAWREGLLSEPERYIPDRNSHLRISNEPTHEPSRISKPDNNYSEEMVEREKKAKEISDQLSKQVAPLYNKGPYQLISNDPEIIKNLGKKV